MSLGCIWIHRIRHWCSIAMKKAKFRPLSEPSQDCLWEKKAYPHTIVRLSPPLRLHIVHCAGSSGTLDQFHRAPTTASGIAGVSQEDQSRNAQHLQLHLIVDNYATHKHPKVKVWLEKYKRFHMHLPPRGKIFLTRYSEPVRQRPHRHE